jgi:hypothetical protein
MDCGTVCERTRLPIDTPPHSQVTSADTAPIKTLNGNDPHASAAGVVLTTSSVPHSVSPNIWYDLRLSLLLSRTRAFLLLPILRTRYVIVPCSRGIPNLAMKILIEA